MVNRCLGLGLLVLAQRVPANTNSSPCLHKISQWLGRVTRMVQRGRGPDIFCGYCLHVSGYSLAISHGTRAKVLASGILLSVLAVVTGACAASTIIRIYTRGTLLIVVVAWPNGDKASARRSWRAGHSTDWAGSLIVRVSKESSIGAADVYGLVNQTPPLAGVSTQCI